MLQAETFAGAKVEVGIAPIQMPTKNMQFLFGSHMDSSSFQDGSESSFMINVMNDSTVMIGKIDTHLGLFGRANFNITDNISGSYVMQFAPQETIAVMDLDYSGKDFTSRAKYMHSSQGETLSANYLQSITPYTALGIEAMHTIDQNTILALTGRYAYFWNKKKAGDIATLQLDERCILTTNYTHKVDDHLSYATELVVVPPRVMADGLFIPDTILQVGARWQHATFRFQCSQKSNGELTSVLDSMLAPGMQMQLSGTLNHFTHESKFGVGLRVGG